MKRVMITLTPYRYLLFASMLLLLGGCAMLQPPPPPVAEPPPVTVEPEEVPLLTPVSWQDVEGWEQEDPALGLHAFLQSCRVLGKRPNWERVCREMQTFGLEDSEVVRDYFEQNFTPYQLRKEDGAEEGTITGYYVPDLNGSREPSELYSSPLYGVPDDMLIVDLADVYPELKHMRLRGRVEGNRVVPYFDRATLEANPELLDGHALLWVDDPVELFFLHIQGSGRVTLDNGEKLMAHYANQNGHPFRSIGRVLIERDQIPAEGLSMQGIKAWARRNPDKVEELLNQNPSYVFFSVYPYTGIPPGALGVPLTSGRSIAVDRRYVPLGAPVFLSTSWPGTRDPLARLMLAQDTGGAIKGRVRADFFWGVGDDAGHYAGRMKEPGRMWVLLPEEVPVIAGKISE